MRVPRLETCALLVGARLGAACLLVSAFADAAGGQMTCAHPERLRVVVGVHAKQTDASDELVNDFRTMLVDIRARVPELNDPTFDYLRGLTLDRVSENAVSSRDGMEVYLADKLLLQILNLFITPEISSRDAMRLNYHNFVLVGPDCGLIGGCLFEDARTRPPDVQYMVVKERLLILTLYALGINSRLAACPDRMAQTLFASAVRLINEAKAKNRTFNRWDEVLADMSNRLTLLSSAKARR